jgi:hypothetical protein
MTGDAVRHQLDAAWNLFQRLDPGVLHLAVCPRDAPAFGETVLGLDFGEVLVHHELDPNVRAPFLASLGQEDDVAIERHVEPLQDQHRHQPGSEIVLVVDRAAAVNVAPLARRAERRVLPLRGVDRDHIGVAHDEQRPPSAVALQPGDHV